jgi:hypothetical protein
MYARGKFVAIRRRRRLEYRAHERLNAAHCARQRAVAHRDLHRRARVHSHGIPMHARKTSLPRRRPSADTHRAFARVRMVLRTSPRRPPPARMS